MILNCHGHRIIELDSIYTMSTKVWVTSLVLEIEYRLNEESSAKLSANNETKNMLLTFNNPNGMKRQ